MNLALYCKPCGRGLHILVEMGKSPSLFEPGAMARCPHCATETTIFRDRDVDPALLQPPQCVLLNEVEAFAAVNGLGLPTERLCTIEELEQLLREQPIRRVAGAPLAGTTRVSIDYLELWDGTKVYFAASAKEAIVYRIQHPFSYVDRV